ncbi:unnamed protein product [Cylindrotheca closterium]|uniref:Uncharacterized protein n=1 Tax=Cylindrotheca closterium TaxID=2856 RepID=A0AAD2FPH1_9STRA|nr:unnamed protein product [Cylindrotheca closterium]
MFQDWLPKANNWLPSVGDDSEAKDWPPSVGDVGDYSEASGSMDMIDMPMSSQDALFGFGMYTIPDNALLEAHMRKKRRRQKAKWVHNRVDWNKHKAAKIYKNKFKAYNRMSEKAFNVLVELLCPSHTMSNTHAMFSTGAQNAISPEVIVSIGLRFMSREPAKSLADNFVISRPSAIRVIDMFLHAVEACKELELRLLTTKEELKKAMEEWNNLSTGTGALWGFIGAIDGWLACTDKPSKGRDLDGNQADYFNGHYHRHGLNIQAICNAKL